MTHWSRGPAIDRRPDRNPFDPAVEGARHRLAPEVAIAIWERVCAEAADPESRADLEQARRRFHQVAMHIAARGGRLRPDVGKQTRVGSELEGHESGATIDDEFRRGVPGRETLVLAEARHWRQLYGEPTATDDAVARARALAAAPATVAQDASQREAPVGASEVARLIAALQRTGSHELPGAAQATAGPKAARSDAPLSDVDPVREAMSQLAAVDATDPRPGAPTADRRLPADMLDRMEQAYGQRFDDVEIHAESAEVPAGQQAFTRGRHIYLEPGAFELTSEHGEHVVAHELAHVAQQSRPSGQDRPAPRAALEADAHQAALSALAGRAASVSLFASPVAAFGFSNGAPAQAVPPRAASGTTARAATPSPAAHAPAPRGSTPAPRAATTPTARPAAGPAPRTSGTPAPAPAAATANRGRGTDGLLLPEAPSALTPDAAGRLHTTQTGNQQVAAATTTLPTAEQQTSVARAAVVEPQAEQDANAQHGVVADVDDRRPPSPEIEAACARIRQVIRDKRPPDEDKLVDAKPKEMAQEAGQQMSDGVEQRAGEVRQGYADMQQNPQGTPTTTPVPATLPPEWAQTQAVDATTGTPDPLHHDDVSLDGDVASQQKQIQDAGMETEPAKLVQDGPIGDARGGVDDLESMAKTDPQKVLADQATAIAKAKGDMRALQASAEKALADARAGAVHDIGKHTTGVKGSEEQQRAQAGEKMKAIFASTQKSVDGLLQPLGGDAVARWDSGVAQLSTAFENSLDVVKQYIADRHKFDGNVLHDAGSLLHRARDKYIGLPPEVTDAYDAAEAKFGDGATNLVRDISRDVNTVIENCKKLIAQARKDIEAIVKSLPASLQTWAQGEAAKLNQQLDGLDKRVDQTQKGINKDLINRANGAVQQVRERVAQLREDAKGALAKIAAALVEFAKNPAKAIVNGLLTILGIPPASFWSLLDRLGDVVGAIAKDPVKFGKTLISGAGQGFKQFFEHFPTHLKEILMGWLFGQLGTAGIPMPTDFSGPGIVPTVLGIVGIDTSTIMSMFGADVSDPAEMAEVHQELAGVLAGDPHALVALFRDHFDPASLVPMIKEAAMGFLIQALITQVAPRIAAMLVPGGAILQAIEAIFKVLMWVVNNAARIFTLIESLVATAGQAVAGNISGVAAGVESGLVQIIVLVIDFLAGYIGLGGIGAKLKGVIMKVAGKLKGVLKKVVDAIAKRAKAKAKAKHDPKTPHDKTKPAHDEAGHPKQDADRDPQKVKDDAKDPRNHQHDPDDKDPRNHHKDDDDSDPRSHKHDDPNAPKRKPEHGRDPNSPKDHDDHSPHKPKDGKDKDDDEETMVQKEARLREAVAEVKRLTQRSEPLSLILKLQLLRIRRKYRLTQLSADREKDGNRTRYAVQAVINPRQTFYLDDAEGDARSAILAIEDMLKGRRDLADATLPHVQRVIEDYAHGKLGYPLLWQGRVLYLVSDGTKHRIGEVFEGDVAPVNTPLPKHPSQRLYKDHRSGKEFVLSSGRQLVQRMVWRLLHAEDVDAIKAGQGMTARMDPNDLDAVLITPLDHVLGGALDQDQDAEPDATPRGSRKSPYISTTKVEDGKITNYKNEPFKAKSGRVQIDLLLIAPNKLFDVSNATVQERWGFEKHPRALEDANRTKEVLVEGTIPIAAIVGGVDGILT